MKTLQSWKDDREHTCGVVYEQLLMFMTGEGETEQPEVIKLLLECAMLHHGKKKTFVGLQWAWNPQDRNQITFMASLGTALQECREQ